jgi:hypothetical protein
MIFVCIVVNKNKVYDTGVDHIVEGSNVWKISYTVYKSYKFRVYK